MVYAINTPRSIQGQTEVPPRVSKVWSLFAEKLALTLANLQEDQYLILSVKHANRFVQFAAGGSHGMRMETTSNHYLSKQEQLTERQMGGLLDAGWQSPTGTGEDSTPERDPDGSPNYFVDLDAPVNFVSVANLTVHTFAEILRIPHPFWLEYAAFDDEGNMLVLPELGLKLATSAPQVDNLPDVSEMLKATLCEVTGLSELDFDDGGDIAIRYGSVVAFVRLNDNPPTICIYSPVVRGVEDSSALFERLNSINAHESVMRFIFNNGAIWCFTHIPAIPYVGSHVADVFNHFCAIADGMDVLLKEEFGGETAFEETMPSTLKH